MAVQLYVGTERGLFTLREGRRGWKQSDPTLERRRIVSLDYNRASPNLLYIAVDNEGIYSSSDAGQSAIFRVGGDAALRACPPGRAEDDLRRDGPGAGLGERRRRRAVGAAR